MLIRIGLKYFIENVMKPIILIQDYLALLNQRISREVIYVKLSIYEAFESMIRFLEMYYERTGSDDVGSLLGDMMILEDGLTIDPASNNMGTVLLL
jgi:hypothetical protein